MGSSLTLIIFKMITLIIYQIYLSDMYLEISYIFRLISNFANTIMAIVPHYSPNEISKCNVNYVIRTIYTYMCSMVKIEKLL